MIALITGGSGCGKSTWAEKLVVRLGEGKRYYIATMQVLDEESVARVKRHREQRADKGFDTLEIPKGLRGDEVEAGATAMLECLPTWLANEMFGGGDPDGMLRAVQTLAGRCENLVVVTNDVFSDGVQYDEYTDEYMRRLAHLNREIAAMADSVVEVVYSIPVALKGELP